MQAHEILQEGTKVLKERASQRDCENTGERSMARAVNIFNALTDQTLTEEQGWQFMIALKLARGQQGKPRADDYIDLASYGALLGECKLKEVDIK